MGRWRIFVEPTRDPEGVEITYLEWTGCLDGRQVLEIGCGNGRLIARYAGKARLVAGVDPDGEKLAGATGNIAQGLEKPLILAQAQAEDLPFGDRSFETVLLGWSL
jgi:ubiquinone/menaquinone biosynthesis C-methylase UbiE